MDVASMLIDCSTDSINKKSLTVAHKFPQGEH